MQSNLFVTNLWKGIQKRVAGLKSASDKKAGLNWWKVKFLKHANPGKKRAFQLNNKNLFYAHPIELLHTLREIFGEEIYNVSLPPHPYIIDCGANIGIGIIYLKEKFPNAEVLAFEPDENNFKLLHENIKSFNLSNVTLKKEAVWIEDTILNFSSEGSMGSKIGHTETSTTTKVKAARLKNFLNRQVNFLKIDIEGAEYEVLKDIKHELINVDFMFLEYHGDFSQNKELTEIFNIVQTAGFSYYIKEAAAIYASPFLAATSRKSTDYDVQLNIFCFRKK